MTETNPDALQNIRITLFKNNQTIILQEGTDYRIEVRGGNGQWYEYIYTVLAKNFADDGVYRLTFYSEDAAGNIAENTLDTKKRFPCPPAPAGGGLFSRQSRRFVKMSDTPLRFYCNSPKIII